MIIIAFAKLLRPKAEHTNSNHNFVVVLLVKFLGRKLELVWVRAVHQFFVHTSYFHVYILSYFHGFSSMFVPEGEDLSLYP